jgi:hypothetical protein
VGLRGALNPRRLDMVQRAFKVTHGPGAWGPDGWGASLPMHLHQSYVAWVLSGASAVTTPMSTPLLVSMIGAGQDWRRECDHG